MKYAVLAVAMNRQSRRRSGKARTEIIDTSTNQLFKNVKTPADVERAYESFWNDLNLKSTEIVKVLDVREIA